MQIINCSQHSRLWNREAIFCIFLITKIPSSLFNWCCYWTWIAEQFIQNWRVNLSIWPKALSSKAWLGLFSEQMGSNWTAHPLMSELITARIALVWRGGKGPGCSPCHIPLDIDLTVFYHIFSRQRKTIANIYM